MHSIIAPVSFSQHSNRAARYAADMALAARADLYLYHVLRQPYGAESGARSLGLLWEELTERTAARINIHVRMDMGCVRSKIESFCREKNPFVIVMGRSFNGLGEDIRQLNYPVIAYEKKEINELYVS